MTRSTQDAEKLGGLLVDLERGDSTPTSPPGLTDDVRKFLSNFKPSVLPRLINSPIRRFEGRTPVHIAAASGLVGCLEILLESGGW